MSTIAFNLPRTVTLAADAALLGLAAIHGYVLLSQTDPPGYFEAYCVAMIIGGVCIAALSWIDIDGLPRAAWLAGSVLCAAFVIGYLISRLVSLPDLAALTGRWDVAPGSLALACAGGFVAVHLTVLLGINVAFGQQRNWSD